MPGELETASHDWHERLIGMRHCSVLAGKRAWRDSASLLLASKLGTDKCHILRLALCDCYLTDLMCSHAMEVLSHGMLCMCFCSKWVSVCGSHIHKSGITAHTTKAKQGNLVSACTAIDVYMWNRLGCYCAHCLSTYWS